MTQEAIFSGFGGQGVLSMAKILAYAGMIENKEVCWMPSYGPEMRGGTANATVIVSDNPISSPVIATYDTVVALNQPSVEKFEARVKPGGHFFYDSTNILNPPTRKDIHIHAIPASEECVKLKNMKVMNILMLGAMVGATKVVDLETIIEALKKVLPERAHKTIPLNRQALEIGMSYIK